MPIERLKGGQILSYKIGKVYHRKDGSAYKRNGKRKGVYINLVLPTRGNEKARGIHSAAVKYRKANDWNTVQRTCRTAWDKNGKLIVLDCNRHHARKARRNKIKQRIAMTVEPRMMTAKTRRALSFEEKQKAWKHYRNEGVAVRRMIRETLNAKKPKPVRGRGGKRGRPRKQRERSVEY